MEPGQAQILSFKEIQNAKAALRTQVRTALRGLTEVQRAAAAAAVCQRLVEQEIWRRAHSILFYAPMSTELDVWPLLEAALTLGKLIALPRYLPTQDAYESVHIQDLTRDLHLGQYNIREPKPHCPAVPINSLDLLLIPGVAFDAHGRRLGRGRGYYDRLLARVGGAKCGLAFDCQVVSEIPAASHDIKLDYLVTPTRWLKFPCAARI